MGKDGLSWINDDDTMTLEEYRKARDIDLDKIKKSDFIEVVTENLQDEWSD